MITVLQALLELVTDLFLQLSIAAGLQLGVEVPETLRGIYLVLFHEISMLRKRVSIKNFHAVAEHDRVRHLHHRRL